MRWIVDTLIAVPLLVGSFLILVSSIGIARSRDSFARLNALGVATSAGVPLVVIAGYVHKTRMAGLDLYLVVALLVTIGAMWIVSSVGSNVLARAAYLAGAVVHPSTSPNDLAPPTEQPATTSVDEQLERHDAGAHDETQKPTP